MPKIIYDSQSKDLKSEYGLVGSINHISMLFKKGVKFR